MDSKGYVLYSRRLMRKMAMIHVNNIELSPATYNDLLQWAKDWLTENIDNNLSFDIRMEAATRLVEDQETNIKELFYLALAQVLENLWDVLGKMIVANVENYIGRDIDE